MPPKWVCILKKYYTIYLFIYLCIIHICISFNFFVHLYISNQTNKSPWCNPLIKMSAKVNQN